LTLLDICCIIGAMILKLESDSDRLYAITSGNWEMAIKAPTRNDACILAISSIFEKFGTKTQLSPTIGCMDITSTLTEITTSASYTFIPTKAVLILAGMDDLAESFDQALDLYNEDES